MFVPFVLEAQRLKASTSFLWSSVDFCREPEQSVSITVSKLPCRVRKGSYAGKGRHEIRCDHKSASQCFSDQYGHFMKVLVSQEVLLLKQKEQWGLETLHVDFLFQSNFYWSIIALGFPGSSGVKNHLPMSGDAGDTGLIPGFGRSPGEGNGNPLQYSSLEDATDRGAWQVIVHRVAESGTTEVTWNAHQ